MQKHFVRTWELYISLIVIGSIMAVPVTRAYRVLHLRFGHETANLTLAINGAIILIFAVHGAMYAARTESLLRGQLVTKITPPGPGPILKPFVFRMIGLVFFRYPETAFELAVDDGEVNVAVYQLGTDAPTRHRGKQPRFPEEKIRKAVLKWVKRDKTFAIRTLPEFLEQEFGSSSDGILLMAPSTFYDWRTRILDEIKAGQENQGSL